MAVAGSGDVTVLTEQIQLDLLRTSKRVVHPVGIQIFGVAGLSIFSSKLFVHGEQIHIPVACLGQPCEVVDADGVDTDIASLGSGDSADILQGSTQYILGTEYLVAATECLDLGEGTVQRLDTQGHGIGVADDPCVGAVFLNIFGDLLVHGDGTHGTNDTAGTGGITYGLVDAVLLGNMNIGVHLVESAGQNGDDHEISAGHGLLGGSAGVIVPSGLGALTGIIFVTNDLVMLRGFKIDVIKIYIAGHILAAGKVTHQIPCPTTGAAAHIGNFNFLRTVFYIFHKTVSFHKDGTIIEQYFIKRNYYIAFYLWLL